MRSLRDSTRPGLALTLVAMPLAMKFFLSMQQTGDTQVQIHLTAKVSEYLSLIMALILFLFLWIRPTFPRLREDQLQKFAWKYLIPVSLLLVLAAGAWVLYAPEALWH